MSDKSAKSAKSARKRRLGRTFEEEARRGAPGAEVHMAGRQHAPELEPAESAEPEEAAPELGPPPEPLMSKRSRRRASMRDEVARAEPRGDTSAADPGTVRAPETRAERKEARQRAKAERAAAAAQLKLERKLSREETARERAATEARVARRQQDLREHAGADQLAEDQVDDLQVQPDQPSGAPAPVESADAPAESTETTDAKGNDGSEPPLTGPSGKPAKRRAKSAPASVESQDEIEHRAAEAHAQAEAARVEAEWAAAEAQAEQEAAEALLQAEREAEDARLRVEREAADEQARIEQEAAAAQALAEREAAAEQARQAREAAASAKVEARTAKAQAKTERRTARAEAKADREAAKARAKVEREVAEARTKIEREAVDAAHARDEAEAAAAVEQARVDRTAEDALASVARAKASAEQRAQRAAAEAEARIARAAAKAEARVARASARAQSKADRAAAKAQAAVERAAVKAQGKVTRAATRLQRKSELAETRAQHAADLETRLADWDFTGGTRRRDEGLAAYVARVESQRGGTAGARSPLTTTVKIIMVTAVVGAVAVLPWAAPSVRDGIADLVPGGEAARVDDPSVGPPTSVPPEIITQQVAGLAGVRLAAAGPPLEVNVPRLHVDSKVIPISGQSGSLVPPEDPQVLGWWREGQPAGAQYGSAVVTGHTVHTGGGALDHLGKLDVGDSVRVRTEAGWIEYVVQLAKIYSTEQLARDADQIFTLGGPGRLVLITCDDWNGEFYESNAVVVGAPVLDEPSASGGG